MVDFKYMTHRSRLRDDIIELQRQKDIDYGSAFDKTFRLFGRDVLLIRLYDKFNRFEKLTNNKEQNVKDESIIDTLIDITCYAVLGIMSISKDYNFSKLYEEIVKESYKGSGIEEAKKHFTFILLTKNINDIEFIEALKKICFYTFHYISKHTYENQSKI